MFAAGGVVLDGTARRAIDGLWAFQRPDGSFQAANHHGPLFAGCYLAVVSWLGALPPGEGPALAGWIRAQQAADGSFRSTAGDTEGTVDATWACIAGLSAVDPTADSIRRAKSWLAGRPPGPLVAGLIWPMFPEHAPPVPLDWVAVRPTRDLVFSRFHSWLALGMVCMGAAGLSRRRDGRSKRRIALRASQLLYRTQNANGSWVGASLFTLMAMVALRTFDPEGSKPAIARALGAFQRWKVQHPEGIEVMPFVATTWNAAMALLATPTRDQAHRDGVLAALRFLIRAQGKAPTPLRSARRDAPQSGGWAYDDQNLHHPDADTTAAVLRALHRWKGLLPDETAPAIAAGRAWLLGMQNADGGFAAFDQGSPTKPRGPFFREPLGLPASPMKALFWLVRPPPEMVDPSTEDLTARVVVCLGEIGAPADRMRAAARFLRAQQHQGRWFGRWDPNYQAGTAYVLEALHTLGEGQSDAARTGLNWLLSRQNADGGFGEGVITYQRGHEEDGPFPTRPDLTALVVAALSLYLDAKDQRLLRARRAIVDHTHPDGTFGGPMPLYVTNLPLEFYCNPVAVHARIAGALAAGA